MKKSWIFGILFILINSAIFGIILYSYLERHKFADKVNVIRFTKINIDNIKISGIAIVPKNSNESTPVVIFSHGFSSFKERMIGLCYEAALHNMIGISIDLRGHKSSGGITTFGVEEWKDASAALDWATENLNCNASNAGIMGTSMGAVVSIMAGCKDPRIKVVCEASGFANFSDLMDPNKSLFLKGIPEFLKNKFNIQENFTPTDFINETIPLNLLVMHGVLDDVVPLSHGIEIYNSAGGIYNGQNSSLNSSRAIYISNNTGHDVWHADKNAWSTIIRYLSLKLLNKEISPDEAIKAINITKIPDLYFYRALPLSGISIIFLVPLLYEIFVWKTKSKRLNEIIIPNSSKNSSNQFNSSKSELKYSMIKISGTIGIILLSAFVDKLLLSVFMISVMNFFIPNLIISIPTLLIFYKYISRKTKISTDSIYEKASQKIREHIKANLYPTISLSYLLILMNLGSYIVIAPFLLPKWTFIAFFIPFLLYFQGLEFGLRNGLEKPLEDILLKKYKNKSDKNMNKTIVQILILIITIGLACLIGLLIAKIYLPLKMELGILNPDILIIAISGGGILFGSLFYLSTKKSYTGAIFSSLLISILMSVLFPAF
ncbi:MAG: alpha/beta hydrolase [Promethearchaeota archaeon]